mmetsp:Transcript_7744/g.1007  ORF Transcript_7744/g.1007 Transcript_7744/m.1007 type:complete len:97 (-) Transcript_7744:165-455(-)
MSSNTAISLYFSYSGSYEDSFMASITMLMWLIITLFSYSALRPSMFSISGFAPLSKRINTASLHPRLQASCKGVSPLRFMLFTSAPFSIKNRSTSK